MSGKTIAIFDDEAYASALSDYLNREKEEEWISLVFTDEEKLLIYLKENESTYLLINETFREKEVFSQIESEKRILLCETRSGEKSGAWIYKYQNAKSIVKELNAFFYDAEDESRGEIEKIHAVFSVMNGLERNEYVKVVFREFAERGSFLYLDMEPFPAESIAEENGRGMSELIYYVKKGGNDLKWKMKSLIRQEGMNGFISPSKCSLDLNEFTKEDVKTLVTVLREMSEYDKVILNIGFYNAAVVELFRSCCSVEVVVSRRKEERIYAEYFIEQMKLFKLKDAERKVQIIEFETGVGL